MKRNEKFDLFLFKYCLGTQQQQRDSKIQLPEWIQGVWVSTGESYKTFYFNQTQLVVTNNGEQTIVHDLKFIRVIQSKRQQYHYYPYSTIIRIRAKSLQQWYKIID